MCVCVCVESHLREAFRLSIALFISNGCQKAFSHASQTKCEWNRERERDDWSIKRRKTGKGVKEKHKE